MKIEGLKNIIYVGILICMGGLGWFSDELGFIAIPIAFVLGIISATIYPYNDENKKE